jgi:predicted RNA binding protein YcfA (HicA-like mRNA interferase family)
MSPRLPAVSPRKLIQALERASFYVDHIEGSHYALRHYLKLDLRVTVPYHNKDLRPATLKSILKQCELTTDDLFNLL